MYSSHLLFGKGGSSTCSQKLHALSSKINMYPHMAPAANLLIDSDNYPKNAALRRCLFAGHRQR